MKKSTPGKKTKKPVGLAPGSMIYVGDQTQGSSAIQLIQYDDIHIKKTTVKNPDRLPGLLDPEKVNWVHIDGIHDLKSIETTGTIFQLHPLMLEDIINTRQRPKVEEYSDTIFVTAKIMSEITGNPDEIYSEQISFVLGPHYLLTFKEVKSDLFQPIYQRLEMNNSRIRNKKSDYLLYAILDLIVDHYLLLTENIGDRIQELEEEITLDQKEEHLQMALKNKTNILYIRKHLLPVKELTHRIPLLDSRLIDSSNTIYYADIYDNLDTAQESLEMYIELNKNLRESYMSGITLKTNEIMKILTIISSLFIPLTFIAGVYGMNFIYMPELNLRYGYLYVWILMIGITVALLFFFKRKKWL